MDNQQQNPPPQPTPVAPVAPAQPTQPTQQPQQPISVGRAKEMPAVPSAPTSTEWIAPSTPEVVLPQEVKEAGVEAKPVTPVVPQQAVAAGVTPAKETTPVPTVKEEKIDMKTDRSVLNGLKTVHKSVKDSISWLIRLVIKEQDKKEKGQPLT